jgi:hypothetical protein
MYYRISDPNDVRELSEQMAVWTAAENPKANDWAVQPAAPSADALTSGMTTSGSIGARLKNAATLDSTGQQLADALSPVP